MSKLQYVPPVPIQLLDEEQVASWATDVHVGDCTVVTGTNGQKFAVWSITITTDKGATMKLLKRYSEINTLREEVVAAFPDRIGEIPQLPPKKFFGNLKEDFLVRRRRGLEFFLSSVLLNPQLCHSKTVRSFVRRETR